MRTSVALLFVLALAGCTKTVEEMNYSERKALADQIVQRCYAQGVKSGTSEMDLCLAAEVQSEKAKRYNNAAREKRMAAGLGAGLASAGDAFNQAAANSAAANRTVTCNTVPAPTGMTKVRCY